jgi:hypothetical protein
MHEYEITRDGRTYTVQLDDEDAKRAGLKAAKTATKAAEPEAKAAEPANKARTPHNKTAGGKQ